MKTMPCSGENENNGTRLPSAHSNGQNGTTVCARNDGYRIGVDSTTITFTSPDNEKQRETGPQLYLNVVSIEDLKDQLKKLQVDGCRVNNGEESTQNVLESLNYFIYGEINDNPRNYADKWIKEVGNQVKRLTNGHPCELSEISIFFIEQCEFQGGKAWKGLKKKIEKYRKLRKIKNSFKMIMQNSDEDAQIFQNWTLLDTPMDHREWFSGISWRVEEYETKIDILREINHRRVKDYSQDRDFTSTWFKREIQTKLQKHLFNYHVNYHPAQLWKLTTDKKLENQQGNWSFKDKIWTTFPETGMLEEIMKEESGFVIGLENGANISGTKITLGVTEDDEWIKGKVDANGWFTLKHKETAKFMTSKNNEDHPTIEDGKTQIIQNGLCYTDVSGKVKCGFLHKNGAEKKRQTCEGILSENSNHADENCHHLNPYRTLKERQLLKNFELDHEFDRSFIKEEIKRHLDKNCNQIKIDHCFELFFTPYNLTYVYGTCHERRMDQKTDLTENEKLKICECTLAS